MPCLVEIEPLVLEKTLQVVNVSTICLHFQKDMARYLKKNLNPISVEIGSGEEFKCHHCILAISLLSSFI